MDNLKRLAMALVVSLSLTLGGCNEPSTGVNQDVNSPKLVQVPIYYQPELLPSVDDAIFTINALHTSFCDWRGGIVESAFVNKAGVDLTTNIHSTQQESQWVPNWGGIIGPGGSYTPYSGGSMQTTPSESDSRAHLAVIPGDIQSINLWSYPRLDRDFKFGFDLQLVTKGVPSTISFRTPDPQSARRLANAFSTLACANFTDGRRYTPFAGIVVQSKDLPSQLLRLGWTGDAAVLLVDSAMEGSPGAAAGLQHDDILSEIAGKRVTDAKEFGNQAFNLLGGNAEGRFDLKVFRNGQVLTVPIALKNPNVGIEKLLPSAPSAAVPSPATAGASPAHLGISARNLTAEEAARAGSPSGVCILSVEPGSLGAEIGLKPGDYLVELNSKPVADTRALKQVLGATPVDTAKVWRSDKMVTLSGVAHL